MPERSPRGTYLRIADALRTKIKGSPELTALPSEAALMREYGAGRSTVKRALDVLAAEKLIRSKPGVGWAVAGSEAKPPVIEQLITMVRTLEVGAAFPPEKKLVEATGASRGTVRSALAQLEGAGVLEVRHGKGRHVRSLPSSHS
ncbi:GntR family transcriptional regulator [Kitasatospora sp. NPDC051984]|uniref:GntR family transcriptional regulator n=1 Tax=Kitasatospora sp. NPDC051984 TaxID=3364059 RepID=UPI0037C98815